MISSIDKIKELNTVAAQKPEALRQVAREFEQIFSSMMVKSMRNTVPESSLVEKSMGESLYTDMLDSEFSRILAESDSLGLTDKIVEQLSNSGDIKRVTQSLSSLKAAQIREQIQQNTSQALSSHYTPKEINSDVSNESLFAVPPSVKPQTVKTIQNAYDKAQSFNDNASLIEFRPRIKNLSAIIGKIAKKYGVDRKLIASVIEVESAGNPNAQSPVGAKGLMQLMDGTASDMGVKDSFNIEQNIEGGTKYLKKMIDTFGDLKTALAAYNAGPGNVRKYKGIPPFKETINYVKKVSKLAGITEE